jgi:hypothetical protein
MIGRGNSVPPSSGELEQLAERLLTRRCEILAQLLADSGPPDPTLVTLLADTDRALEVVRLANGDLGDPV